MSINGVIYTPRKTVRPTSYNGVKSTGFRAVNVIPSRTTTVNKTVIVDDGCCCEDKKSSKLAKWLVGICAGALGAIGLSKLIGKKGKGGAESESITETQTTTQNNQTSQTTGNEKTLFGGMLNAVGVKAAATDGVKQDFKTGYSEDIEQAANELKEDYKNIISDIALEKQSNGSYKAKITVPDSYKHDGKTVVTNVINVTSSDELVAGVDKVLSQLLKLPESSDSDNLFASATPPEGSDSDNPFAPATPPESSDSDNSFAPVPPPEYPGAGGSDPGQILKDLGIPEDVISQGNDAIRRFAEENSIQLPPPPGSGE